MARLNSQIPKPMSTWASSVISFVESFDTAHPVRSTKRLCFKQLNLTGTYTMNANTKNNAAKSARAARPAPSNKKATVIEDARIVGEQPQPQDEGLFANLEDLLKGYGMVMPSTTRWVVSLVVSAATGGVIGYAGGTLLGYCIAGVLTFSGSALLAFLTYIVGVVLILIAAYKASGIVGGFILSGGVDRCYENVSNKVGSWFSSSKSFMTSKVAS